MRFQSYSMAGAVALVGCSIFALAGAVVFSSLGNSAQASVGGVAPALAASAIAQGGGEPTIVWYGVYNSAYGDPSVLYRAWSDGKVEMRRINQTFADPCGNSQPCVSPWFVVVSPHEGLAAFADINADAKVDGVDLAQVLSNWGPAPRNDIPPSNCPLNLINP